MINGIVERHAALLRIMAGMIPGFNLVGPIQSRQSETWIDKPRNEWPQITMINQIEYVDKAFPICDPEKMSISSAGGIQTMTSRCGSAGKKR